MSHLQQIQGQAKAGVLAGTKRRHCGTTKYSGIPSCEVSEGSISGMKSCLKSLSDCSETPGTGSETSQVTNVSFPVTCRGNADL